MTISKNKLYLFIGIVVLVLCVSLVSILAWVKTPEEFPPLAFNAQDQGTILKPPIERVGWDRNKAGGGYSSESPLTNNGDEAMAIKGISMPLELKKIITVDENGNIISIVEKRSDVIPNISFEMLCDRCGEPIQPGEQILVGHRITGTFLGEFEIKDVYVNYSYKGKEMTTTLGVPTIIRIGLKNWETASGIVRTIDPETRSITVEWITAGGEVQGHAQGQINTVTLRILNGTAIRMEDGEATFEDLRTNMSADAIYDPATSIAVWIDIH